MWREQQRVTGVFCYAIYALDLCEMYKTVNEL